MAETAQPPKGGPSEAVGVLLLSLPAIASSVLEPVAGMVDTAFLGRLEVRFVAALAVTVTVLSSFTWVFNFLVNGVTAQVGQAVGRGDRREVGQQIKLALLIAAVCGGLSAALLLALRETLFGPLFGADASLTELARPYFLLRSLGMPLVLMHLAITGILRGLQRIGFSLLLNLLVTLSNVVATWCLLFVWPMGMTGAAWGTVGSFALGTAVGGLSLLARRRELGLDGRFHFERRILRRAVDDSGNLILRTGALVGAFALTTAAATRLGEIPLAAHQIGLQLWLLSSFLVDGLAITGNMLGARYLGEGQPQRRRALGRTLLLAGLAIGAGFALLYGLLEGPIARIFTRDASVLTALSGIWWIVAYTQPMNALVYVYDGLLFGSRAFAFLRRHMLIGMLLIFIPALFFSFRGGGGLAGVWLSLTALNVYRAASCSWGFHRAGA